jgi:hypothetical protein
MFWSVSFTMSHCTSASRPLANIKRSYKRYHQK